jgi:hypothetical protein
MIKRLSRLAAGAFVVGLGASTLIAQGGAGAAPLSIKNVQPRFDTLRTTSASSGVQPAVAMPTWNYSFKYLAVKYKDTFVGTNPATSKVSTKIPVDIIPVKLTCGSQTWDSTAPIGGGDSAVQQTLASPLFQKNVTFTEGSASVKSQYEDAFQKVSLWNKGASSNLYHVVFKTPTVEPTFSWNIPSGYCGTYTLWGVNAIYLYQSYYDSTVIQPTMTSDHIPANVLPIFVTENTFLLDNGGNCCIGGYHGYNGVQTYSDFNYLTNPGGFSQDVSALSHELGEWMDDPYLNNSADNTPPNVPTTCPTNDSNNPNPLYEVGDPLEGNANYGDYAYTVGGFTYHLQDLVTPEYFGAPTSTSANHAETFQGGSYTVCQNGG